jgi:clan AA aspartic protease
MGHIYADLTLSNPSKPDLRAVNIRAMADSGAVTLCIPQHIALQLGLTPIESREVVTADGQKHTVPYVGPIKIQFDNRTSFAGAFVLGEDPLLGAIQMEDMDLVLFPREEKITVNPNSPNIACGKVMQFS